MRVTDIDPFIKFYAIHWCIYFHMCHPFNTWQTFIFIIIYLFIFIIIYLLWVIVMQTLILRKLFIEYLADMETCFC